MGPGRRWGKPAYIQPEGIYTQGEPIYTGECASPPFPCALSLVLVRPAVAGRRLRTKAVRGRPGGVSATKLPASHDTALRLLEEIKESRLDPRDLTKPQRQACLLVLANGVQTSAELAELLGVSPSLIRKDMQQIRSTIGREVREWDLETVLGQLAMRAERCQVEAMRQEDPGLAWSIQRDLVKLLKELGVVGSSDRQEGLRITVEALGAGYERARQVLGQALDPRLTGLVEDEPDQDLEGLVQPRRALALRRGFPDQPSQDPGIVIDLDAVESREVPSEPSPPASLDPDDA